MYVCLSVCPSLVSACFPPHSSASLLYILINMLALLSVLVVFIVIVVRHSNPVEVFDRALGVHVCLDDGSEVAKNILSWKCEVLKVRQGGRQGVEWM